MDCSAKIDPRTSDMWNIGTLLYGILLMNNPMDNLPRINSMTKIELNELTNMPWQESFHIPSEEIEPNKHILPRWFPLDKFVKSLVNEKD
jgi:hypothetical protein